MKKLFFISLIATLFFSVDVNAAKRYYIMTVAGTWNTTLSWSTSSGGASGASVPGASDTAYFDAGGNAICTLDAGVNVKRIDVSSGYTSTIIHSVFTITIGTGGAAFNGGTFSGGSADITASGAVTIAGTAFTSTSGTFSTNSNFTLSSGSFTHNSGKFISTATSTITGTITFHKVFFSPSANSTYTIANTITCNDSLSLTGSSNLTLNTGTIDAKGHVTVTNSGAGGGTATINITDVNAQTLTGSGTSAQGSLPHVVINKSSGTLTLGSVITVKGNWTWTAGTLSTTGSTVVFYNTKTITGTHGLNNVTFSGSANAVFTIASGNTLTVNGTTEIAGGSNTMDFEDGNLDMKGNITLSNTTILGVSGDAIMTINGTTKQTLTGASAFRGGEFTNLVINKSDTLVITNTITIRFDYTYTAGVISAGTSTVYFDGINKTITGTHALYNVFFYGANPTTYTIASGTTLTINGTMSTTGQAVTLNTGTIHAKGNISWPTTSATTGGGNATLVINGDGSQTITGSTTAFAGRLPKVTINKSSGTLSLVSYITSTSAWTYTSGTVSAGTSTVYFVNTQRISGSHTLNNISFSGGGAYTYTVAASTILTADGNVAFSGSGAITLDSGTVYAQKNVRTTNTSTGTGGNATIVFKGTGADTLTGSGTAGQGKLPHLTIDKTGSLRMESIISVTGHWIYTQGTVSPTTSSVALYGTFNVDGQGTSASMSFYRLQVTTGTRTVTGNIDANDNFTISSGATCVGGSYTITVGGNWNSQGTWTYGTSTVVFDGTNFNWIAGASGVTVNFANVSVNRRSGKSVRLLNPMKVNTSMTFQLGRVKSDATNYLEFADNATCTVDNDDSAYVHGPVRKTGNDAFSFPLGDTTLHDSVAYHPLAMSAPSSSSDRFEAIYNATGQTLGSTIVDSLYDLSTCEKWSLERQVGTSNVLVTLSWNRNSCNTDVYGNMRVANWNGSGWADLGASAISVLYGGKGTVISSGNPTYVSNFAYLTTAVAKNNFPTAILKKKLDGGYYKAINGRLFFRFDEEYYDTGDLTFNIYDDEHTLVSSNSMMPSAAQPQVVYGDNRFRLNTVGCEITPSGPLADGFYILEVINDKNEKWYLRFEQDANIMIGNCPPPTEAE
jgi:hypothetical protein